MSIVMLAALAAGGQPTEIVYFLPNVRVAGAVSHRLIACPNERNPLPTLQYTPAIAAKAVRGRAVAIDPRAGLLVDRTTKLTFQDGMLKEFNATSKGQGAALIVSVIKAAAKAYTFGVGPVGVAAAPGASMSHVLRCTEEAENALTALKETEAHIKQLEDRLVEGPDAEASELLKTKQGQADELKKELTFEVATEKPLDPQRASDGSIAGLKGQIPATEFIKGLGQLVIVVATARSSSEPMPSLAEALVRLQVGAAPMPGQHGYELTVSPNGKVDRVLGCPADASISCTNLDRNPGQMIRTRDLVYVRAIPAAASLTPIWNCVAKPCEEPNGWSDEASAKAPIPLPQLGRLAVLPTGGGSIFGSRKVAATFDPLGEPAILEYEQGGGAADVASLVDAAAAEASTVRDAELQATKREIELIKARKELEALLAPQLSQE